MRRPLLVLSVLALATGGGIATASALLPRAEPFESAPDHLLPGPAEALIGASAPDPAGGTEWAVRTYISRTGGLCAEAGRLRAGIFGDIDGDGRFTARPLGPTGACGDPTRERLLAAVDVIPARGREPPRTVVLGASLQHPVAVRLGSGDAQQELALGSRGAFVAALDGVDAHRGMSLAVTFADGHVHRLDW